LLVLILFHKLAEIKLFFSDVVQHHSERLMSHKRHHLIGIHLVTTN